MARVISNVHNTLVEAVKSLPRLNDKFHVSDTEYVPYADLIYNDDDCKHMQQQLNHGTCSGFFPIGYFIS